MGKGKQLSLILASGMLVLSAAACSSSASAPKEKTEQTGDSNETKGPKASEKPMEMTIHLHYNDGQVIFDDNWSTFKKAAEVTNVSLKGVAPKSSTKSEEAFNLMIASGKIPDLVFEKKENLNKYGKEGAFIPLEDLIKEHAPHIQSYLDKMPEIMKVSEAADGHLYYLPFIADGEAAEGWFIRQDWLDKLGLKMPQTVDEYYTVLKAFKEKDPNGNGKADEVPLFSRINQRIFDLASLWGGYGDFYLKGDKVAYGPMEIDFGTAMENLAKWYGEGLIDPEIFTRGATSRDVLFGNNTGGSTHDWFASTVTYNDISKKHTPDFNLVPMAPPENAKGERVEPTVRSPFNNYTGVAIGHSVKDKVAAIKYLDYFFTEEGRRLMNYGVEGDTYTVENGVPTFTKEVLSSPDVPGALRAKGAQIMFAYQQDFEYEKQWMAPLALEGVNDYVKNDYFLKEVPALNFTEEEEKIKNDIGLQIMTYRDEMIQKWMMGAEPVDFAQFKKRLKEMGVDQLIKVHKDAYDRYTKG
ncbi:extracellular solute-binding protein [Bacillus sp. FJAT-42376]|uniref:extracellular solute-binding protein n=1 Tax=Bacillus sp. FJAT-42376 TaxID=2014076 RepID=UPI000F5107B0|nr:extracellular solute-binding protein [Bacillus sp. FJAT-42376]AZB42479.1 extracellular solute-binding protein [Bacillus sp. FJAT-42376]